MPHPQHLLLRALIHLRTLLTSILRGFQQRLHGKCIRIDVKIPGGVNAYIIDLRGER